MVALQSFRIARGRLTLQLHLLSPEMRNQQIDLPPERNSSEEVAPPVVANPPLSQSPGPHRMNGSVAKLKMKELTNR